MSTTPALLRHAVVIAVGSELLTPHKIDTNSLFVIERLNDLGVDVRYKIVVGDARDDVAAAVREAISHADLVVVTGGLGPTDDDVTRDAIVNALGLTVREDVDVLASIRSRFDSRHIDMPSINRRQALVPEGAVVLPNPNGTAPGLWLERNDVTLLLLPGPPRELGPMFERFASEHIASRTTGRRLYRRVVKIVGHTESQVETLAQPVYAQWSARPTAIGMTILASPGQVELHLSTHATSSEIAAGVLGDATNELRSVLGQSVVSTDGMSLEAVVGQLLLDHRCWVAVAESCTGGLIACRLTDVPGTSGYLRAGWVVYSNEAKQSLLGVDPDLISVHGSVSEEVAAAMASGARQGAVADYGLGITGVAGPGGGTADKPVGFVCVAVAGIESNTRVRTFRFPGGREAVRFQASQMALDMLRRELIGRG